MPTVLSRYGFWKDILANKKTFENIFYGENWTSDIRSLGPHGCMMAAGAHGKHCDGGGCGFAG